MANTNEYLVLGLMSGTSLDGVDLALCRFTTQEEQLSYKLLVAETIKYPYYMKEKLEDALYISTQDLHNLDQELARFYANQIITFIKNHAIAPDLIASHGHTILHQPDKGITLQIGDGDVIAQQTRIRVISDFRIQDVSKGGQGAPLVPIGDRDLFGQFDFCLNLGGIANASFDLEGTRIACDISPCNMALNTITSWIEIEYDNKGELASKGSIDQNLLERLNSLEYYKQKAPKSLGKEWFLRKFLPEIRKTEITIEDVLRTVNEHIADQIAVFINSNVSKETSTLVSGGGVHNTFLLKLIKNKCRTKIVIPDETLINFKEAMVFAYLGLLRIQDKINVLSSVTGASSDTSAGIINNPN
jgi:anhydro-N-acetylmuramic acid kinase